MDVHDPWVSTGEAQREYGIEMVESPRRGHYDAIILAVPHRDFVALGALAMRAFGKPDAVLFDVRGALPRAEVDDCL